MTTGNEFAWLSLGFWTSSPEDVRNMVLGLVAVYGAMLATVRVWVANRSAFAAIKQAELTAHGQVLEHLTKSVSELQNTESGIRLSAVLALERLAKNSVAEVTPVHRILSDFLATKQSKDGASTPDDAGRSPLSGQADAVAAVSALLSIAPLSKKRMVISALDLRGVPISSDIRNIEFRDCNLTALTFDQGRLKSCHFLRCLLAKSSFSASHLENCRFEESKCEDIRFSKASLHYCNFEGSNVEGGNFAEATLHSVRFVRAQGTKCVLQRAKMVPAHFIDSNFADGDFSWVMTAHDFPCGFSGSTLDRADFRGAMLLYTNLSDDQLSSAVVDDETSRPDPALVKPGPTQKAVRFVLGGRFLRPVVAALQSKKVDKWLRESGYYLRLSLGGIFGASLILAINKFGVAAVALAAWIATVLGWWLLRRRKRRAQ